MKRELLNPGGLVCDAARNINKIREEVDVDVMTESIGDECN